MGLRLFKRSTREPGTILAFEPAAPATTRLLLAEGEAAVADGRFPDARGSLQEALAAGDGLPMLERVGCLRLLASALDELSDYSAALSAAGDALDLLGTLHDDDDGTRLERVRLLTVQGQILVDAGRAAEAEGPLLEALRLSPPDVEVEGALALRTFGEVRSASAQYAEAEEMYARARDTLLRLLPVHHRERGHVLNSWGNAALNLGRIQDAETRLRQGLELRRQDLPPHHPDIGESLHNLTVVALRRGRLEEAEQLAQAARALWEESLGPDHPRLALVLGNLGSIAMKRGRFAEAEDLHRRGLAIREATLGPTHPRLIVSLNNLAAAVEKLGRDEEAEMLFRRSLELAEEAHGPEHPDVARALNNLHQLLNRRGKEEEAEACLRRAIGIWERCLGPDAVELSTGLTNLALDLKKRGEIDGAEELLLRALAIRERRLGTDHPDLATALNNLANLYVELGRLDGAEALFERALDLHRRAGYRLSPETLSNLADIARRQGRGEVECDRLRQAIEVVETSVGPDSPALVPYLRRLAATMRRLGDHGGAVDTLRRACTIQERSPAATLVERVMTLTALGGALSASGDNDGADGVYRQGIEILEAAGNPDSGRLGELYILLGALLIRRGHPDEAAIRLQRGQNLAAEALGPAHGLVLGALIWRGYAEIALGNMEAAEQHLLAAFGCGDDGPRIDDNRAMLALHGLRRIYQEGERPQDLATILERLIDLRRSQGAPDGRILSLLHELAVLHLYAGDHRQAAGLYRRILAAVPRESPPGVRATAAYYLAICFWHLGDEFEAHAHFSLAADALLERGGSGPVDRLFCLATWMDFLISRRRHEEALLLVTDLSALLARHEMPPHAAGRAHQSMGNLFAACRRWEAAEAALQQSLAAWQSAPAEDASGGALIARYQLARLDHARGRHDAAEQAYLQLVRHMEDAGPGVATGLVSVLRDYANLLEQIGRVSEAVETRGRAQSIAQRLRQ